MSEQLVYTRLARRRGETTISNAALLDTRLTLAQRGLFALMLTTVGATAKPARFYLKSGGISAETFYKYVGRLEALGYLERVQKHSQNGQFSATIYTLNDAPCAEKPYTEKPCTEKPYTENPYTAIDSYNIYNNLGIDKKNNTPKPPREKSEPKSEPVCAWKAERFLAFWEFYRTQFCSSVKSSRAGERGAAAKAWDDLKLSDARINALAAKLSAIMRTDDWKRGLGVPAASTLLNRIKRRTFSLDELPEDAEPSEMMPRKEVLGAWM